VATVSVTMRQTHRAGDKCLVDFSGDGLRIVDPQTGVAQTATLFVAVLGASNLTYLEPVLHQDLPTWIECHVRAFAYFGGVSAAIVPDNLKSGVTRPSYYDPELNPTYAELARHYDTVILPARPHRPRDKAKVEQGVLLAERWVLAVLRDQTFHTLAELHDAVLPLMERLNARPMRQLKQSRRALFEAIEQAALQPLPAQPYEYSRWTRPTVSIDYHVAFDDHYYSVPYPLVGQRLELRTTVTTVELFRAGRRVASHVRSVAEVSAHDAPRAHAGRASRAPRVDAVAAHHVGRDGRAGNRRARHGADAAAAAPRAGLSRVSRRHALAAHVFRRAARARLCARGGAARLLVPQCCRDPPPQSRSSAAADYRPTRAAAVARQHPRRPVLPLTGTRGWLGLAAPCPCTASP
jgi:transposase